jgi:hypothetical protein
VVRLDIAGKSRVEDRWLVLSVELRNLGDTAAAALRVEGALAGRRAEARADDLAAGGARLFELRYPADLSRPGRYVVPLVIEYHDGASETGPPRSQLGYLLAPLGAQPPSAFGVHVGSARFDVMGRVPVAVESRDGTVHRARVELLAPSGLNVLDPPFELEVPAGGRAEATFRVLRATAATGVPIGVLATAQVVDGPLQRDAVGEGRVTVLPHEPWLPRLRRPLVTLAASLLLAAVWLEWRARRRVRLS